LGESIESRQGRQKNLKICKSFFRAYGTLINDAASILPGTDVPGYIRSSFQEYLLGGMPFQPPDLPFTAGAERRGEVLRLSDSAVK